MRIRSVAFLFALLLSTFAGGTLAAATKTVATSGNWSNPAIWSPAGVPGNNDDIIVPNGLVLTLDVNSINMRGMTIDAGGTFQGDGTGKIFLYGRGGGEDFVNNGTLNASGANAMTIKLNRSSQWAGTGTWNLSYLDLNTRTLIFTAGATIDIKLAGAGDPILSTGTITPTSTITVTYNGTSAQTLSALSTVVYNNLVVTNAAGVTMVQNLTTTNLLGNLTVSGGGLLKTGDGTNAFSITGTAGKTLAVAASSTLNLGSGTAAASAFPTGFSTVTLDETSTVEYSNSSSATQTVSLSPTYGNVTFSGSGAKSVPTGTLTLLGNWTNSSTGTVTLASPQTVAFSASASAGRTIGGTTSTTFYNLAIGNTAGVTLGINTTASNTLSLGANKVITGSNIMVIAPGASLTRTSGYVDGFLRKTTGTGSPTITYEIGDASTYAPVTIAFGSVSVSGTLTAKTTAGDHPNLSGSLVDPAKGANRYWAVTNSGVTFTNYAATLTFAAGDLDAGASTGNFIVGKYDAGTWTAPTVGTLTSTSSQATGMTAFSEFAVGELKSYSITASAGANGSISPSGTTLVSHNGSQGYTITPSTGYHVADVLVDGASVGAVTSYSFTNVTANHTISATFAIDTFTITASAGANGSVTPAGATTVNYNAGQSYTITPATGYHVVDVLVDGGSVGAVTSYSFSNVTANHTISATFAINVYTITASSGANGSVTPSGVTNVNYGGSQAYTITPSTGYHVADVLVDGSSVGAVTSYSFTNVTANHTISATFAIDDFTITASAGANGSISPSGVTGVSFGGNQSYTITPATGYHVADVLVDGSSVGAVTSYTFTSVAANHTISASFAINTYTVTASSGANGSVTPAGVTTVNYNGGQAYAITPNTGYHVLDVLVDGSSVGAVTSYSFSSVTANHTISATFAIDVFTITSSAGANGSISPLGATSVNYAGSQGYTITPATGYHVADVLVDGSSVGAVTSYSFTNVTANHTISATFAIDTFTITASSGANGSVTPAGATTVNYGGSQGYTITPATGYHVVDVLVDGGSVGAVTSYSFTNVTANHTISATFAIDTFTITASSGANGSVTPAGVTTVNYDGGQGYTITPATGYHVADVLVDGSSVGAVTSYSFTNVTANHTISATFAIDTFTITASSGANGSVTPAGATTVNYNGGQAYTITPNTGYHVLDVLVDGSSVGAVTSYTFSNVTANHTISATFALNTYTITASSGANGSVTPSGVTTVNHGGSQGYTITPNTGYHVADVLVDGSSVGAVTGYTFTNVTANHTISATFAIDTFTITASSGANGSVTPAGATIVNYGGSQAYTITPNTGYHVVDVLVDGSSVGAVTFVNV
jgi:hypothetical protein